MYPRFKINLIGLAVALSVVLAGYGLGEPPRAGTEATTAAAPSSATWRCPTFLSRP
jgi:hypothetical protein